MQDLAEKEKGLIARFFNKLFGSSKVPELEDDFDDEPIIPQKSQEDLAIEEETREVLRLLHKWLSRLPPEQIYAFRRSEEFERYKTLLQHYGVAKKE